MMNCTKPRTLLLASSFALGFLHQTSLALADASQSGQARIELNEEGKPIKCVVGTPSEDGLLFFATRGADVVELTTELELYSNDDPAIALPLRGQNGATWATPKTGRLSVRLNGEKVQCNSVAATNAAAPSPSEEEPDAPDNEPDARIAALAAEALRTKFQVTDHKHEGDVWTLYHLPDGTPAFTLPRHISEEHSIKLVVVAPDTATVGFDVQSCADVPEFRISGSFSEAKKQIGKLQAMPSFRLFEHEKLLNCAEQLTYKLDVALDGGEKHTRTVTLQIDPIYHLRIGVTLGFDFGQRAELSLKDRPDGMDGTEKFVSQNQELSGFRPLISVGFHPFGANPNDWGWDDALLNPTVLLDPTALSDGFAVGFMLRPVSYLGLLAGVSVFKSEELDDDSNASVGQAWAGPGDLPKKRVFNDDSVGLIIGIDFAPNVLGELL